MTNPVKYQGDELSLFAEARNWKIYTSRMILPYTKGNVLEVGAGIGSMTNYLYKEDHSKWVLAEPDTDMADLLRTKIARHELPGNCSVIQGTIDDTRESFDTIIYIDVMEHIRDDKEEVKKASALLKKDGHLIILSPAHQSLYSPFDKAIGHYRRYTKKTMSALADESLEKLAIRYLDITGMLVSLTNKWFLKQDYPTKQQIRLWDKAIIPLSVFLDRIINYSNGKSILGIWKKATDPTGYFK